MGQLFGNGPVVEALERGAVLLLDEVDLANNKILCLQSILEGKGVFLKKTGRYVQPTAGFNVIATAHQGQGSDDGRFIGTNVLNEAFLERFALTLSKSILPLLLRPRSLRNFLNNWVAKMRSSVVNLLPGQKSFARLSMTVVLMKSSLLVVLPTLSRAFSIFGKRMKAIEVCVNRFDDETKTSFIEALRQNR